MSKGEDSSPGFSAGHGDTGATHAHACPVIVTVTLRRVEELAVRHIGVLRGVVSVHLHLVDGGRLGLLFGPESRHETLRHPHSVSGQCTPAGVRLAPRHRVVELFERHGGNSGNSDRRHTSKKGDEQCHLMSVQEVHGRQITTVAVACQVRGSISSLARN